MQNRIKTIYLLLKYVMDNCIMVVFFLFFLLNKIEILFVDDSQPTVEERETKKIIFRIVSIDTEVSYCCQDIFLNISIKTTEGGYPSSADLAECL